MLRMSDETRFEDFLISKRIDPEAFRTAEPGVWDVWKKDFDEMHPASFTVQKLNLINLVRRKYLLAQKVDPKPGDQQTSGSTTPVPAKSVKPLIKPRTN
jgi:hypothetical protein